MKSATMKYHAISLPPSPLFEAESGLAIGSDCCQLDLISGNRFPISSRNSDRAQGNVPGGNLWCCLSCTERIDLD